MSIALTLFTGSPYLDRPNSILGWLGFLALVLVVAALFYKWRRFNKDWNRRNWTILAVLAVIAPLAAALIVLRLPAGTALPPPGVPDDPLGPGMAIFSAVAWMFAAGLLGPWAAGGLGLIAGLVLSLGDTHSPFTPFEFALMGLVAGALFQQRYRTPTYRLLRHPLAVAALLALCYPLLYTLDTVFMTSGILAIRLDYALAKVWYASLAVGGVLLVAGLFAEVVAVLMPQAWGRSGPLVPSPAERRLEARFLYGMVPLAIILVTALILGDWYVAGNAARNMLRDRMGSTAKIASDTVPFFLEAGQNLIQQLANDERLLSNTTSDLEETLEQDLRSVPFFSQLFLLDGKGRSLAGYPMDSYAHANPPADEQVGVELASAGVPIQMYTIPPQDGSATAQISFMATITGEDGEVQRILIGRTDLAANPFTKPVIAGLREMAGTDGEGMLLDAQGQMLYHPNSFRLMEKYTGSLADNPLFYDDTATDGTRRMVYYQPVVGHPWSVVIALPARRAQQMALNIAAPLLGILLALLFFTVISLRLSLKVVTASLHNLSGEAERLANGQLDHRLAVDGDDEVGQLRRAFEQMRVSLKARLDELNRLLLVSQGVASSLEMEEAVRPLLESALISGASAVRVTLAPSALPEADPDLPASFGAGPSADKYIYLDPQVLALTRQQDRVMLNNLGRVRALTFPTGVQRPEAVLALALRHENTYYGALWLAFDKAHQYTEDEIRFLVTLAGQAALAASNTQLFQNAEIGRQRLAGILASTPDPVLVTDQKNCLLLANPAAWQVLGLTPGSGDGKHIERLTGHKDLIRLMSSTSQEKESAEIVLTEGRTYLATASTVVAEGKLVGRVCVLRDITHFKELDALKSEFVATVSHDLRSPLTLMRGYATMLEMVGELNEQQTGYVKKIITAVESMSRLVNNLLDLRRIEAGIDLQLETVLLYDIVERVTGALQIQATQKHIIMAVEIAPNTIPLIEADQALLQQAFHNLVENAIKYTESGGQVKVYVYAREDGLVFEVGDTGIGIAPVDLPRLFEKFYRGVQREAKKQPGTGLGLAIVKSIAERHGGRVWVESQLGQGSTFFMLIPVRQSNREDKKNQQAAA